MTNPKVSIIIPIYNEEKYLHKCIDSAIQQTLRDIEIICIDDGSTDSTHKILSDYVSIDKRIRVFKHDTSVGKGDGAPRNTGIDNAKGDYIFNLDADDTIPSDALAVLYKEARDNLSALVKGVFVKVHKDKTIEHMKWLVQDEKIINTNIHASELLKRIPTSHCTYLYKRQFLNLHKIRYRTDLIVGADIVFLTEALTHASTVTLLPNIVYNYHHSTTSVIHGAISKEIAIDAIKTEKIVVDMLYVNGLDEPAIKRLQSWKFHVDAYWKRMQINLTPEECHQVFSEFRANIANKNVVPWNSSTPHHVRYILALLLSNLDDDALSFMRQGNELKGVNNQASLKESLEFVLTMEPGDIGSLLELRQIALTEGNLDRANELLGEILRYDGKHLSTQLEIVAILRNIGRYEKACDRLDTMLENRIDELESYDQIKKIIINKNNTIQVEKNSLAEELNTARREVKTARRNLYNAHESRSWKVTAPMRWVMRRLKNWRGGV